MTLFTYLFFLLWVYLFEHCSWEFGADTHFPQIREWCFWNVSYSFYVEAHLLSESTVVLPVEKLGTEYLLVIHMWDPDRTKGSGLF